MKIGFIGAGKQAQTAHLPNYAIIDQCRIGVIEGSTAPYRWPAVSHSSTRSD